MVVSLSSRDFFPPLYLDPRFRPLLLKLTTLQYHLHGMDFGSRVGYMRTLTLERGALTTKRLDYDSKVPFLAIAHNRKHAPLAGTKLPKPLMNSGGNFTRPSPPYHGVAARQNMPLS